jgi:sphingomyelin phosphodiesterase
MGAYVHIIMNDFKVKTFEPNYFCEILLPVCKPNAYELLTTEAYSKRVLADKPDFIKDNNYINNLYKEIEEDKLTGRERETILMYHLSDLHWNMNYKEGTNADCNAIVCCTVNSPPPKSQDKAAGKWGDYRCDGNPAVFGQLKHTINMTGVPDFITWTGDNPDHGIYKDPRTTTNATLQVTKFIEEHTPNAIIFPIHGNHEFDPMNTEDFYLDVDPVIDFVSDAWAHWLTPEVLKEYKKKTFFSYDATTHPDITEDFKKKMEKTRIIALNTNNCYFYNFYLIGQFNDPKQQLEWFENLLREMEKNGEVGILIGHMPPGAADCINDVSARINVLLDRFQHIIRLNLYGHTHNEEFEVIRSIEGKKAIGVNHVSPSITTFVGQNPSVRVITLDLKTKIPVKIETFTFDIKRANEDDTDAKFIFDHEMSQTYGMKDLSPQSFLDLTERFNSDEELAKKYLIHKHAHGSGADKIIGCDQKCRRMLSCFTSHAHYRDTRECYNFTDMDSKVIQSYLFDFVYGKWVKKNNA